MTVEDTPRNRPIWEAASTHPEQAAKLDTALREVVDPEIGMNIIQLGLIRDVKIADEETDIKMILTTPFCPYGPALIDITRKKAEEALGKPTLISLGMDVWDFSMMEEGLGDDWGLY
jgi:metal-sulfur cluster biosynthetic enzyme